MIFDPDNSDVYLQSLKQIASDRQSEGLAEKAMTLESQGFLARDNLQEAYHSLGIDFNHRTALNDEHIINVYKSRAEDVGRDEKVKLRQALKNVGQDRKSAKITRVASSGEQSNTFTFVTPLCLFFSFKSLQLLLIWTPIYHPKYTCIMLLYSDPALAMDNVGDAWIFLDVSPDIADDFVVSCYTVKVNENATLRDTARKAVQLIADKRSSSRLHYWLQHGTFPNDNLAVRDAYTQLDVDENAEIDDQHLVDLFSVKVQDSPGFEVQLRDALSLIAEARGSSVLKNFLGDNYPTEKPLFTETNPQDPRGLKNIGNTCYLNSLLQYFSTIKAIRSVLENFGTYQEEVSSSRLLQKKVGGVLVTRQQISRAQKCKLSNFPYPLLPPNALNRIIIDVKTVCSCRRVIQAIRELEDVSGALYCS